MAKTPIKPPNEKAIRALLTKRVCPVGYHEVRTRLLGAISSPDPNVKPMSVIASLWVAHRLSWAASTMRPNCLVRW